MLREMDVSVTCCTGGALSRRAMVGLQGDTKGAVLSLWKSHRMQRGPCSSSTVARVMGRSAHGQPALQLRR